VTAPLPHSNARVWPLHASVFLVMAANGLQGTLLGLRATAAGFGGIVTGVVMACYYTGFLIGPPFASRAVGRFGHVRVFTGLALVAAVTAPIHGAWVTPAVWGAMRLAYGFAMAGIYVVWESWLNNRATNTNRGRLLARYMLAMMTGFAVGPLLLNLGNATTYALFLLPAGITLAAIFPVIAAGGAAPAPTHPRGLSLRELARMVPTGVVGAFVIGIAHGGLIGMGAVYGRRIGLDNAHVALFMFAAYGGSALSQLPLGWLYDHMPRRAVLLGVCLAVAGLAGVAVVVPMSGVGGLLLMLMIGGLAFPLYGLTNAYTNDWVHDDVRSAASAGYVLVGGLGAIAGPVLTALAMNAVGSSGYFWMLVLAHLAFAGFVAARVRIDRAARRPLTLADPASG
jgi:MFS family permease